MRSLLLVLLLACPAWAADTILPATGKLVGIVISDEPGDWGVLSSDLTPVEPIFRDGSKESGWRICIFEGPAGRYAVIKVPKGGGLKISTVVLGAIGPTPPPVVTPPVTPPVNPPPPVSPLAGMRVLMIYESDTPLPKEVYDAIMSPVVEEYLRAKCLKGPDGKTPERRRLDDDPPLTGLSQAWQNLRSKLPADLPVGPNGFPIPQIAIGDSSGVVVFSGPVPANEAMLLELLKRFGGP